MVVGGSASTLVRVVSLGIPIPRPENRGVGLNEWRPGKGEDMALLAKPFEGGEVEPMIGRRYPLRDVPEALRYPKEEPNPAKIAIGVVPSKET